MYDTLMSAFVYIHKQFSQDDFLSLSRDIQTHKRSAYSLYFNHSGIILIQFVLLLLLYVLILAKFLL